MNGQLNQKFGKDIRALLVLTKLFSSKIKIPNFKLINKIINEYKKKSNVIKCMHVVCMHKQHERHVV